jgi:hypothetical protein
MNVNNDWNLSLFSQVYGRIKLYFRPEEDQETKNPQVQAQLRRVAWPKKKIPASCID